MIEKLTPEQQAQLAVYRDKWIAIGRSTEPANWLEAERGVQLAYEAAKLKTPEVIWCDSPKAMVEARIEGAKKTWKKDWRQKLRGVERELLGLGENKNAAGLDDDGVPWDSWAPFLIPDFHKKMSQPVHDEIAKKLSSFVTQPFLDIAMAIEDALSAEVGEEIWYNVSGTYSYMNGQHDTNILSWIDYLTNVMGIIDRKLPFMGINLVAQNSGWWLSGKTQCFVSERPELLLLDDRGKLHCDTGPAIRYPDGWSLFFQHGAQVAEKLIKDKSSVTVKQILQQEDFATRDAMIAMMGHETFFKKVGGKLLKEDQWGRIWQADLYKDGDDDFYTVVEILRYMPGPDGPIKDGFYTVEHDMRPEITSMTFGQTQDLTVLNAIAASVGLTGNEYREKYRTFLEKKEE